MLKLLTIALYTLTFLIGGELIQPPHYEYAVYEYKTDYLTGISVKIETNP